MAKIIVKTRFKDKLQADRFYEVGQEVEFSDEARVKDLVSRGIVEIIGEQKSDKPTVCGLEKKKVFIVHGKDDPMLRNAKKHIKNLGFEPVVLREQASKGNAIIEKFERCAEDCIYSIALLSPDDKGQLKGDKKLESRARQNVILEYGYMMGKLGRKKVAMILKGDVDKPSDIDGLIYIKYGRGWGKELRKELEAVGLL